MPTPQRRRHVNELQEEFYRLFVRRRYNAIQLVQLIDPELEPVSYSVLSTLQKEGPQRMTRISRHLGIGKPSLSRQLATLEERGFVTRVSDPEDGRAMVVSLTAQGKHRLETAQAERAERYLDMLEPWSEEDVVTLSSLLAKLNNTYAAYDGLPDTEQRPAMDSLQPVLARQSSDQSKEA